MNNVLVLLSTYNGEKYLEQQLDSLISQKDVSISILVRDDSSKDRTIGILERYKEFNVNYYVGSNKGAAGSFFDLIHHAPTNYDYYAFCDQDDYWESDKLISAVKMLSICEEKRPAVYYSGQKLADTNLNLISNHKLCESRSARACFIFNQMAGCTSVINCPLLRILQEYKPNLNFGHDVWCYKLCAVLDGFIVVESEGHILYRQHGGNVVGFENGFIGKIHRACKYLNEYYPSVYAHELLKGYESQISESWLEFLQLICKSPSSINNRLRLIFAKDVVFHSVTLKVLYVLKALLGKM
ncbi:MAG: glycosyltransferase [Lachnospiraceae bacterium]|nr:glycosyltransferase [Lachnospiraceae bacterium]